MGMGARKKNCNNLCETTTNIKKQYMIAKFLYLEWKSFIRSASFKQNLFLKILMGFLAIYFIVVFLSLGILAYYGIKELKLDPLQTFNKFLIYYLFFDLMIRYFIQKVPTLTIRPLMLLPINKNTVVHFTLAKSALSIFNFLNVLLFLPFSVVLMINNYSVLGVISWFTGVMAIIYSINYLNIIINTKDNVFYAIAAVVVGLIAGQYYGFFNITQYTMPFFEGLYHSWYLVFCMALLVGIYFYTYNFYKKDFTLDARLAIKKDTAKTENLTWLNQFGTLGTFLKNDIKLIKRNKRSKTTLYMSLFFLMYGLIFFTQEIYLKSPIVMFAGVFITGGFMINFGQFIPSWDSAFYPLMMTQNVSYKEYLNSKWWLIVISIIASMILASFYLYFGLNIYLIILAGGIYNLGFNVYLVLFTGAFTKTPIDLTQGKGAFGDKKAFNIKTLLFSLPQMGIPVLIYWLGLKYNQVNLALLVMVFIGLIGLVFKQKVFSQIEKLYKKQKYSTLEAYKQKN